MAQNTTNVLVGAANIGVGTYGGTGSMSGDSLYAAVRAKVTGSPKDYRTWLNSTTTVNAGTGLTDLASANAVVTYGTATCTVRDVGLTSEGVEVAYQPDFGEVEVDQLLDAAKLFKQKMSVSVNTSFTEAILENLLNAWSQGASSLVTSVPDANNQVLYMVPGSLGEAPQERALIFVGNAPGSSTAYKQRVYMASRAISVQASSHRQARTEATTFPVSFRLLPDTASSYSAYGRIVDVAS
jgi:hypothetical protein